MSRDLPGARRRAPNRPSLQRHRGALPNLIVIGAQKCGTTSLHLYLGLHPDIAMAGEKELNFFADDAMWRRGVGWYASQFDARAPVRGEASPRYTMHPIYGGVPERMWSVVPDTRLVYMVRDPLQRMLSDYIHTITSRRRWSSLAEALVDPAGARLLVASRYATQLRRYLEHFPRERILVVDADEMRLRTDAVLATIFRFVGVDPDFRHPGFRRRLNEGAIRRLNTDFGERVATATRPLVGRLPYRWRGRMRWAIQRPFSRKMERPELDPGLRRELTEELAPEVAWLREWTGLPFATWQL